MNKVLWFTGLSGAGKSTIANGVKVVLEEQGKRVAVIDGDDVRSGQHKHLGFSREDIRENNRLIAELVKQKEKDTDVILVPIISPFRDDRASAQKIIGKGFLEVFIHCPLDVCIDRDTKGLYQKAKAGQMDNLIGYSTSNPYEAPERPDIEIRTDRVSIEDAIATITKKILYDA